MPISRLGLPFIFSATEGLYRTLEAVPEQEAKWQQSPNAESRPAELIERHIKEVLNLLMPSGVHDYLDCSDISTADLDLSLRADLSALRNRMLPAFEVASRLANHPGERDEFRLSLERFLARSARPPSTSATPNGTQQSEGEKSKPDAKPDGPFDADGFRFAGVDVRFGKAGKQYRLVMALWDAKKKSPAAPRPIEDVIAEVWGDDNETEDSAFRQLCADTRTRFQKVNCPLDIRQVNGKVQLSPP